VLALINQSSSRKKKWATLPCACFYYPNDIHMKLSSTLEEKNKGVKFPQLAASTCLSSEPEAQICVM